MKTAGAAFTSGDGAKIDGSNFSKSGLYQGAKRSIGGNVTVGANFTSGANSVIGGNVYVNAEA